MIDETQAELFREFRLAAEDTVREWLRRWADDDSNPLHAVYHEDGSVELNRELPIGVTETVRFRFAVGVVPVIEEPHGDTYMSRWDEVREGDWISPDGSQWFKVTDVFDLVTSSSKVVVEIEVNGKPLRKPRARAEKVRVRTRTKETSTQEDAMAAAIATLVEAFPGSEVLS